MRLYIRCLFVAMMLISVQQCDVSIGNAEGYLTPMEQVIRKTKPDLHIDLVRRIAYVIETEAHRQNLNPDLVAAIVWTESRFTYTARGKSHGEIGLMQIRYEIWIKSSILRRNGVDSKRKLQWIGKNIRCGTEIFKRFLDQSKGDVVRALYRYNSGKTRLPKGVSRYKLEYPNKVLAKMYDITETRRRAIMSMQW